MQVQPAKKTAILPISKIGLHETLDDFVDYLMQKTFFHILFQSPENQKASRYGSKNYLDSERGTFRDLFTGTPHFLARKFSGLNSLGCRSSKDGTTTCF